MRETVFYINGTNDGAVRLAPYKIGDGGFLVPVRPPIEWSDDTLALASAAATNKNFFHVSYIPAGSGNFSCTLTGCAIGTDASLTPGPTMDLTGRVADSDHLPSLSCSVLFPDVVYVRFATGELQAYKIQGTGFVPLGNAIQAPSWVATDDSGSFLYTLSLDGTTLLATSWKLRGTDGAIDSQVDSKSFDMSSACPQMTAAQNWSATVTTEPSMALSPFSSLSSVKSLLYVIAVQPQDVTVLMVISLFESKDGKFSNTQAVAPQISPNDQMQREYPMAAKGPYVYTWTCDNVIGWKLKADTQLQAQPIKKTQYGGGIMVMDNLRKCLCTIDRESAVFQIDDTGNLTLVPYKTVVGTVEQDGVASVVPVVLG